MPDSKLWLIHEESGAIFQGSDKDIPGDGCVEELGPLVTGLRAELEGLLFARGWSARQIVDRTEEVAFADDSSPTEKMYIAGVCDGDGVVGVFAGPSSSVTEVLLHEPPPSHTNKPVFVFDANENKTHRWHWGRQDWIKINPK